MTWTPTVAAPMPRGRLPPIPKKTLPVITPPYVLAIPEPTWAKMEMKVKPCNNGQTRSRKTGSDSHEVNVSPPVHV